jgi:geranylgeranylglycerol-phosphate geranylgeranyltransferase
MSERVVRPRSVRELLGQGTRWLLLAVRGRSPALGIPLGEFAWAVFRSLRPHYFVFPGAAALAGAAAAPSVQSLSSVVIVSVATALSWGIGQLINDLVDVEADRIDAPHRAGVRGLLPEGPTVAIAILLAIVVAIAVASVGPLALGLLVVSALLLLGYHPAKTVPGLGNLAHGALMGSVAALGFVSAAPEALERSVRVVAVIAIFAGVYLQANYEKDAAGDRAAGYRTLAHVLGLRRSALVRLAGGLAGLWLAWRFELLGTSPASRLALASSVLLVVSVALAFASRALVGYRFAVHATTLALSALASPLLGVMGSAVFVGVASLVTEHAFLTSKNP